MRADPRCRAAIRIFVGVAVAIGAAVTHATDVTWTGDGASRSWSNMANWSSAWTAGPDVNLMVGSGFASGQPLQNITSSTVSGFTGVQIGSLTIAAPSPVVLSGSRIFLNSDFFALGSGSLSITAPLYFQQDSRLTVNTETVLSQHIEGAQRLIVAGTGRLVLASSTSGVPDSAQRPTGLVADGGAIGIRHAVGLPGGATLTNNGRLDALQPLTLASGQVVTIEGSGILRNTAFGPMQLNADQLRGSGTLTVQSRLPTNLPPNLPPNFFIRPGQVRLNGANDQFFGDAVIDGGELVVSSIDALGSALAPGGFQTVTIRSGALNLSGSGALTTPDLSRVVVERGGILRLGATGPSPGFSLSPQTVPMVPVAGMISIVSGSIGGTGTLPLADGGVIQYAGQAGVGFLRTNVVYAGSSSGTVTLAGSFIPNRNVSWGGVLNVTGTVTEGAAPVTLQISGAGVILGAAQHSGGTVVANGRLEVTNVNAFGQNRSVLLSAGSQLDLRANFTADSLPVLHRDSAGMIGTGSSTTQVSNSLLQSMDRGLNSIGPAFSGGDYVYSLSTLAPGSDGVYRFGTVTQAPGSGSFLVPRAFKITQPGVLTDSAAVVVGMPKGPALGSGGSILTINANQTTAGPFTVRPDFFLATEQNLTQPFGMAGVTIRGRLLATGAQGSFVNLESPLTFQHGSELWLDYAAGANVDRWQDDRAIPLEAGALRLRGNASAAVSETVGVVEYAGRSRISLDQNNTSPTNVLSLRVAALSPSGPGSPTLEISKAKGTERLFVTTAPTPVGSANLVTGVYDTRNHTFVTWNDQTQEIVAATATQTNSFVGANSGSFVDISTATTVTGTATALAVRTSANITKSGSAALVVGNGEVGMLIARSTLTIAPDLTFAGAGQIYTAPNTVLNLTGMLDAPNGLVKLGGGDLHLRGGLASGGGRSIRLREGRLLGSGTFAGWSIIAEGSSILAPGDSPGVAEVLGVDEVASLESNDQTVWEFELQALDLVSDKWIVTGNVILNGFVDVINYAEGDQEGTMQPGIYELITWDGEFSGNGLTLREMPEGFFGQLTIDQLRKVVELEVSLTGNFAAVPEPATWGLLLAATGAAGLFRRRRTPEPRPRGAARTTN